MAVAYVDKGLGNSVAASTTSWTHNILSSGNTALIASIAWTGTGYVSCAVTYNSVAMTPIASLPYNRTGNTSQILMFYMLNPPTGNLTVSVTVTATTSASLQGNSQFFTGVTGVGNAFTAYGTTGTNMLVPAASFKGMMAVALGNSGTATPAFNPGGGTLSIAGAVSGNEVILGYATDTGDLFTFSATMSSNALWAGIAAPIRGVDSGSGATVEINKAGTNMTVPAGTIGCRVTLIGGGGGGGAGSIRTGTYAAGTNISGLGGGGGGGGAAVSRVFVPAAQLGTTYTVARGASGAGGATAGTPGTNGGASSFVSSSITITVNGGTGGLTATTPTGTTSSNAGGGGGTTSIPGGLTFDISESGAAGGNGGTQGALAGLDGVSSTFAGAGGGGGGANISSANNGGTGGHSAAVATGGTFGAGTGGAGAAPLSNSFGAGGAGGGGGTGGATFTSGGAGGAGGTVGAGGGGGGGKEGGNANGGAGAAGAVGGTQIEWLFGDNNFMNFYST